MRDLLKVLAVGIVMFFAPFVYAEEYKVLVIPDNIVTENEAVDAYIYNAASEFSTRLITLPLQPLVKNENF